MSFPSRKPSIAALSEAPCYFRFTLSTGKTSRVFIDMLSANAILAIYNAGNEENKAKIERMITSGPINFMRVADFAFKHTKIG